MGRRRREEATGIEAIAAKRAESILRGAVIVQWNLREMLEAAYYMGIEDTAQAVFHDGYVPPACRPEPAPDFQI